MVQQNSLVKYAPLFHFIQKEAPVVADDLRSMYVESMGRTLLNLFKSYYTQLAKQDSIVVSKTDLIAVEEATLKSLFVQKVDTTKKNDTFALGDRDKILEQFLLAAQSYAITWFSTTQKRMQKPSSKLKPKTPKRSTTKNPVEEPESEPVISHGLNRYHMGAEIGKGGFAVVFQAFNAHTGQTVAVKRFPLSAIAGKDSQISVELAEIELMHELDHPNIVKYYDTVKTKSFLYIVLEYMENGSLANVIKKFGSFSESLTAIYIMQVLRGLKYLHDQGVLHRDIKGANILTSKDGQVKLADFGVAMKLSEGGHAGGADDNPDMAGSPYWMAPEIIEMSTPTSACDIWSVGCVVIELLTSKPPYYDMDPMSALFRIVSDDYPPFPEGISQALKDFLLQCFHKEPAMRSSAEKLLDHPWLGNSSSRQSLVQTSKMLKSRSIDADGDVSVNQSTEVIQSAIRNYERNLKPIPEQDSPIDSARGSNNHSSEKLTNLILQEKEKAAAAAAAAATAASGSSTAAMATPRRESEITRQSSAGPPESDREVATTSTATAGGGHKVEFSPWPSVHLTGSTSLPGSAGSFSRSRSGSDDVPYTGSFAISADSRGSSLNSATQLAIHSASVAAAVQSQQQQLHHHLSATTAAVSVRRSGFSREPSIDLDADIKASPLTMRSTEGANSTSTSARSGDPAVSSARSLDFISDSDNLTGRSNNTNITNITNNNTNNNHNGNNSSSNVAASSHCDGGPQQLASVSISSTSNSFLHGMKVVSEDSFDDITNWDIDMSVSRDSAEEPLVKQALGRNNISNIKHMSNTHSTSAKSMTKEPCLINLNNQSLAFIADPESSPAAGIVGTGRHMPHAKLPSRAEQLAADASVSAAQPSSKKMSVPMIKIPLLAMPGNHNSNNHNNNNNKPAATPKSLIYSPSGGNNSSIDLLKYQEDPEDDDFADFDGGSDKFSERGSPPKSTPSATGGKGGGQRLSPLPVYSQLGVTSLGGSQRNVLALYQQHQGSAQLSKHSSVEDDFEDDFALDGEGFSAKIKAFKTGGHNSVLEMTGGGGAGLLSNRSSNQSVDPGEEFSPSSALSTARTPRQGGNLLVSHLRKRIQQVVTKDKDKESMDEDFDAFINYQYDEKDFKQNEAKDLHFRCSREIVEVMNRIRLETKVKEVIDLSNQLLTIFSDIPEQRDHLITHHGVMPIVDMFDTRSSVNFRSNGPHSTKNTKALYVLKVVNKIIEGSTKAKEQLSLVGIIPTVMSLFEGSFRHSIYQQQNGPVTPPAYTSTMTSTMSSSASTDSDAGALTPGITVGEGPRPPLAPAHILMREEVDPLTLEAARFIHQICSTSSLTLQMLIGAGGLSVLTSMVSLGATIIPQAVTVAGVTMPTISTGAVSQMPLLSSQAQQRSTLSGSASPATEARAAATHGIASMLAKTSAGDFSDAVPVTDQQLADDSLFTTAAGSGSRQQSGLGLVEMDDAQTRMMIFHMGIDCITEVFAMKASRSRDFCRLFAKLGLLQPLSLSFQNVLALFRARQLNLTNAVIAAVNADTASISSAGLSPRDSFKGPLSIVPPHTQHTQHGQQHAQLHRRDTSGSTLASPRHHRESSGSTSLGSSFYIHSQQQDAEESAECRYAFRIATLFFTFSRSDAIVAETMVKAEHCVLHVMLNVLSAPELRGGSAGRTTPLHLGSGKNDVPLSTASLSAHNASNMNMGSSPSMYKRSHVASLLPTYVEIVDLLLKCLKNLSMEPSALGDLEAAGTLDTLVPLLSGPINDRCKNHILPCIFNMCRVNKRRQERVAALGLVPHLKKVITDGTPLRQFALPILFDLAHTSNSTRAELSRWNCLPYFLDLLKENYWQAFALNSIAVWLSNDSTNVASLLVEAAHLTKLIEFFKSAHAQTIHTLHRPLLDMMFKSPELCQALGLSGVFTAVLIKRLKGTDEAIVLRSLLKMLQLLHEAHHAPKEWVVENNLVALVEEFAKAERKVLVRQLAKKLLLDFKETSY